MLTMRESDSGYSVKTSKFMFVFSLTSDQNKFILLINQLKKNCELVQEFGLAHPEVKSRLNRICNSSFPGSLLWDLSSENVKQIVNSWSVSARICGVSHKMLTDT